MPGRRSHGVDFKPQVVAESHAGETLRTFSRRRDLPRNLIGIRVGKSEAGALDRDLASAEPLSAFEVRIAALERLVGRRTLGIEVLKGAQTSTAWPKSGPASVTTDPAAFPLNGGERRWDRHAPLLHAAPKDEPSDEEIGAEVRAIADAFRNAAAAGVSPPSGATAAMASTPERSGGGCASTT